MNRLTVAAATLAATFGLPTMATGALPDPVINGVVVEDVTRSYSFDEVFFCPTGIGCRVDQNFNQGLVRSQVIREADGTYDFAFRVTTNDDRWLSAFSFKWTTPVPFTVSHVAVEIRPGLGTGDAFRFSPTGVGDQVTGRMSFVTATEHHLGLMHEAVLVLDTEARAYTPSGGYTLTSGGAAGPGSLSSGSSGLVPFFAPVPEPETWALMLIGLGFVTVAVRRRRSSLHAAICL